MHRPLATISCHHLRGVLASAAFEASAVLVAWCIKKEQGGKWGEERTVAQSWLVPRVNSLRLYIFYVHCEFFALSAYWFIVGPSLLGYELCRESVMRCLQTSQITFELCIYLMMHCILYGCMMIVCNKHAMLVNFSSIQSFLLLFAQRIIYHHNKTSLIVCCTQLLNIICQFFQTLYSIAF